MINPKKRYNVSKFQGVFFRESSVKRYKGAPDRCFDICYKDRRGKLVWEKVGWTSEKYTAVIASQVRSERLRSMRHGEDLPKEKPVEYTLGDVWKKYDEWLETAKREPDDDRSYYRKHIKSVFANSLISKISPFDLEKLKIKLKSQGYAPATIKHILVLIRQLINKAIAWGMWKGENPIKKVKLPSLNNRRERFLNKEEAKNLLEAIKKYSQQTHYIALISLQTGMRAGEIFDLKWGHLDMENGFIHVADPKSGRARKAFMTETLKNLFEGLESGKPEEYVFPSRINTRIDRVSNSFMHAVNELKLNEGITDRRQKVIFHTLRHTFASWLAIQGTPILTIKELLGHQTLAMTERYSHLSPDQKRQAVQVIEDILQTSSGESEGKNEQGI
jgi:integrase